jgi:hypothetical protein
VTEYQVQNVYRLWVIATIIIILTFYIFMRQKPRFMLNLDLISSLL